MKKSIIRQAKDNTSVKKTIVKEIGPSYKYLGKAEKIKGTPSKSDTSTYIKGYNKGLLEVSRKNSGGIFGKYTQGLRAVGLSNRFNEGFSEGKDKALKNKKNK